MATDSHSKKELSGWLASLSICHSRATWVGVGSTSNTYLSPPFLVCVRLIQSLCAVVVSACWCEREHQMCLVRASLAGKVWMWLMTKATARVNTCTQEEMEGEMRRGKRRLLFSQWLCVQRDAGLPTGRCVLTLGSWHTMWTSMVGVELFSCIHPMQMAKHRSIPYSTCLAFEGCF